MRILLLSLLLPSFVSAAQSAGPLCEFQLSARGRAQLPIDMKLSSLKISSDRLEQAELIEKVFAQEHLLDQVQAHPSGLAFLSYHFQSERLHLKTVYSQLHELHSEIMAETAQLLAGLPGFESQLFRLPTDFRLLRLQKITEAAVTDLLEAGVDPSLALLRLEHVVQNSRHVRKAIDRILLGQHPGEQVEALKAESGPGPFFLCARELLLLVQQAAARSGSTSESLRHLARAVFFETVAHFASLAANGQATISEIQQWESPGMFTGAPLPGEELELMSAILADMAASRPLAPPQ